MSILDSLHIGAVSYLNAKPLVFHIGGDVVFKHPSLLSADFSEGKLDIALLPIFSILGRSDVTVVDGISISSRGSVYSVILAHRGNELSIKKIHLDPASRTSTHLLQVICRQFLRIEPEFSSDPADCDAQLLIGDQAIQFRKEHKEGWQFIDLGEEWTQYTGLPFVYAVWAIQTKNSDTVAIANALREIKAQGVKSIPEIIAALPQDQRKFANEYLNRFIRYGLGEQEKEAIRLFTKYLKEQKFLEQERELSYV
ncbi:MAG: menaquinone biosynthesis protein [Chthoniobacterales bacterium]